LSKNPEEQEKQNPDEEQVWHPAMQGLQIPELSKVSPVLQI